MFLFVLANHLCVLFNGLYNLNLIGSFVVYTNIGLSLVLLHPLSLNLTDLTQ